MLNRVRPATLPITDGKKLVNARIDAQSRENVSIASKTYHTIRYEAFLFDNVLYKRKGRLFIWLTDDADRIPVQLRFQLGIPDRHHLARIGQAAKAVSPVMRGNFARNPCVIIRI